MSQSYPLDPLIRRIDRRLLPERFGPEEHLVIFDARARKVLAKEPLLSLGRDVRYFLVSTRQASVECGGPVCKVKSPGTRSSCEIEVSYEVRCERGSEAQLVTALHDAENPGVALDGFISDCVQQFVSDPANARGDICLELLELLPRAEAYITQRARQEVGVTLRPTLRLPLIEKLAPITVRASSFQVRVRDYDREVEIKLRTDLEVDNANTMQALLHYHQITGAEDRVKKVVRKVLSEEISLHGLCYELGASVRNRLMEAINEALRQEGRVITYLEIESPEVAGRPAELEEIEHLVECGIRDYEGKILVRHRLQLTISDLGRFRRAAAPDLRQWAERKLDTVTRSVLFELTYLDLLLDRGRAEIKEWMERESEAIGYRVKQLLTLPALDPLEWKDALPLDPYAGTYVTKNSRIEVRLNIVVKGKITNLSDDRLQRYLTPNSKIADDMRAAIRHEIQALMHTVDPERFYMRFDFFRDGELPLRQEIEEHLGRFLTERFAIEEIVVLAKPLETEITRRLAALQEQPHELKVTSFPLRSGGRREEVEYTIFFKVEGVHENGWHTFLSQRFGSAKEELEAIKKILCEDARTALDTIPSEVLQYTDIKILKQLLAILNHSDKIVQAFGFFISIISMRREPTPGESAEQALLKEDIEINQRTALAAAEMSAEARLNELRMLEDKRQELEKLDHEEDDSMLGEVIRRIAALHTELLAYPSKQDKQHVTALPAAADGGFDLRDYQREFLPASETKRLGDWSSEGES